MRLLNPKLPFLLLSLIAAGGCTSRSQATDIVPAPSVEAPIEVPDPSFEILVAAADSVLPRFGGPAEKLYINDSLVARVLNHVGAGDRFTQIARDTQVTCDGSSGVTGKLATMRIYGIYGDSAAVAWSSTCMRAPQPGVTSTAVGGGGTYNLLKAGEDWVVTGAGLYFVF